jgi:hypothetical protein
MLSHRCRWFGVESISGVRHWAVKRCLWPWEGSGWTYIVDMRVRGHRGVSLGLAEGEREFMLGAERFIRYSSRSHLKKKGDAQCPLSNGG